MNTLRLMTVMREKGVSAKRLCEEIGVSFETMQKRLKGESEFTLCEIESISKVLSLEKEQIVLIFFNQ